MTSGGAGKTAVAVDDLRAFWLEALAKAGVDGPDARTTADVPVATDTRGVHTHGVKALGGYVRRLRAGGLRARARPAVVSEGPGRAAVDGDSGLGMVVSVFAMGVAIRKANARGTPVSPPPTAGGDQAARVVELLTSDR